MAKPQGSAAKQQSSGQLSFAASFAPRDLLAVSYFKITSSPEDAEEEGPRAKPPKPKKMGGGGGCSSLVVARIVVHIVHHSVEYTSSRPFASTLL